MSGTAGDLGIKIGVDGLPQFEAAFNQLEARLNTTAAQQRQYEQSTLLVQKAQEAGVISSERASQALAALQSRYETQGRALNQVAQANDNVAGSANRMAGQVQNASYQVGDFFVQVASGQSAITALAQQLPQLLGGFGMVGALAGAGVAIGAVIYRLMDGKTALEQHKDALKAVDEQYSATTKAAEEWTSGLDDEAKRVNLLRQYYRGLTEDVRAYEVRRLEAQRRTLNETGSSLQGEAFENTSRLQNVTAARRNAENIILSKGGEYADVPAQVRAVEQAIAQFQVTTAPAAQATLDLANALKEAQQIGGPLTGELDRVVKKLDEARPALVENAKATDGINQQLSILRGQEAPGAVGALADLMRQADAAKAPFAGLQQSIADTNARLQALKTGGLDALKSIAQQQTDAAKIRKIENDLAAAEAQRLQQTVQDEAERARLFREGAAERTRLATEAVQSERTLASETERAENARREAEQRARAAATASRRASTEALAQERAEAQALAKVWDTLRRDGQSGLLVGSENDQTALRAIRDAMKGTYLDPAERDKREREEERARDKRRTEEVRVIEDITRYSGDAFADMFLSTERGWSNLWENMRRTAIATAARIAAEAIIRPVVAPIVSSVLSPTGSGGASSGGLATLLGLAGTANSASNLLGFGGLTSFLGGGGGAASSLTSLGSLSGLLSMPVLSTGSLSGATTAALGGMSTFGPATPGAVAAAGATTTSLGSLLGGAGAGFGAGMLLNSLVGGKSTGGMVGSGAGALAGAAIGSIVPGVGTLIGGLIGGAGGGLLGGLFGANEQRPASSVQIGIGPDGQLMVVGDRSKGMSSAEGIASTQQTLAGLNARVASSGLSLRASDGAVAQTHQGTDANAGRDAEEITRVVLSSLQGGSEAVMQVIAREIAKGAAASLDQAFSDIDWIKTVYEPLTTTTPAISAFQASLDAVNKTFDDAEVKAESLGLATADLAARQVQAIADLTAARDRAYATTGQSLFARQRSAMGDQLGADLLTFDANAQAQREALAEELRQQGAEGEAFSGQMRLLEDTLWWERKNIAERGAAEVLAAERSAAGSAANVIRSLADYSRSLAVGADSPLSAQDQFAAAQRQFNAVSSAALAGDANSLSSLQNYAQTYLTASRSLYGSTEGYAQAYTRVQDVLGQVGDVNADTLTASFLATQTQDLKVSLVNELQALRSEVVSLRREQQQANARQGLAA